MTADVMFYTEEKQDVLYVPSRAVRLDDQGKYVRVLKDDEIKNIYIEAGLRGDGGLVEIISGLEEGQEIIVNIIENK